MTLSVVKSKRKVSCLPCRFRKVKCCGELPCQRCVNRKKADECTYLKPGQVGRPPKNAVINKIVLNRTKQPNTTFIDNCKEFIFETPAYSIGMDAIFINDDSTKTLCFFINSFFNYEEPIMQIAISKVNHAIPYLPDVKMYDLLEIYTSSTCDMLNVVVNRLSALVLDNFYYYDAISASVFQDMTFKYFSEPPVTVPPINPLSTLSPYQAVHLIDIFFTVNPHSIILNRTLVLQGYWTDALDPLLLCVIYGTASYMSKMINGEPLRLWDASDEKIRNPFLEYAYVLVQRSSSEVSLAKYQAVVLLGQFEVVFGFPKRGLVNLGLAFMIGLHLGVADGSFQEKSNDIQAELATYTFWASFNSASRGVIDLGQIPHHSKKTLSIKFPPSSIQRSVSYKLEKASGDLRKYRSYDYLVESFYTYSVCCRYTSKLLLELPEVRYNMFYPRLKRSAAGIRKVGYPKPDDLGPRLRKVNQEFATFIQETKHTWSPSQVYSLETLCALYDIHLIFIKHIGPVVDGINFSNTSYDFLQDFKLLPDDPDTMARIQEALPKAYQLMNKTYNFLSDPANYNNQPSHLPRGLIVSVLETAMEIMFLQLVSDPWDEASFDCLKLVETVTQQQDIWNEWTAISAVQARIKKYFDNGIGGSAGMVMGVTFVDDNSNDQMTAATLAAGSTPQSSAASFSPTSSTNRSTTSTDDDNDLACAAFFDPCGTWLNPMRNLTVDLRLLPGIPPLPDSIPAKTSPSSSPPVSDTTLYNHSNDILLQPSTTASASASASAVAEAPPPLRPLQDYNDHFDSLTTSFVTELETLASDDQGTPLSIHSNTTTKTNLPPPSSNYLSPQQYNLSFDSTKYPLDPSNESFIPFHYPTPTDDDFFI